MSRVAEQDTIAGLFWGSARLKAFLIASDGSILDQHVNDAGVGSLDREDMVMATREIANRWPEARTIYAAGMIGSPLGWLDMPYVVAPAGVSQIAGAARPVEIGDVFVTLLPGVACRRSTDDAPDVMRGEEVEMLGAAADLPGDCLVAIPGVHAKWASIGDGCIADFFTSLSGEIFDRMTAQGLLASIATGAAENGPAFIRGVSAGRRGRPSLSATLFGVRAMVVRGDLPAAQATSYLRGLLIGGDLEDADVLLGGLRARDVAVVGGDDVQLTISALFDAGCRVVQMSSETAVGRGFAAIDRACCG